MIFFSKWYRNLLRSTVASVLKLEKERKIRSDFIEFYETSIKPTDSPVRRSYFAKPKRYYIKQANDWGEIAKEYNPLKKPIKTVDKKLEEGESVSDIFTIIDTLRTLAPWIFTFLSGIAVYTQINEILSLVFLAFSLILVVLGWFIEMIRIDVEAIQTLNSELVVPTTELYLENGRLPEKEKIIGPYIWNRSLSNYSTISVFLTLLLIKTITPKIYAKIRNSMIRILPGYMPLFVKNPSRITFFFFLIKNSKLLK